MTLNELPWPFYVKNFTVTALSEYIFTQAVGALRAPDGLTLLSRPWRASRWGALACYHTPRPAVRVDAVDTVRFYRYRYLLWSLFIEYFL